MVSGSTSLAQMRMEVGAKKGTRIVTTIITSTAKLPNGTIVVQEQKTAITVWSHKSGKWLVYTTG
jgi:hypothetical protein